MTDKKKWRIRVRSKIMGWFELEGRYSDFQQAWNLAQELFGTAVPWEIYVSGEAET
jgi:hypothetical protein